MKELDNLIVKEVNNSLIKLINKKINTSNELSHDDYINLKNLGFSDVSTINNFFIKNKYKNFIEEYKLLYPQHPFITYFEIREILIENPTLKFNIASNYKYSIPKKNIQDILNFNKIVQNKHIDNTNVYGEIIPNYNYEENKRHKFYVLAPNIMFGEGDKFTPDPIVFFKVYGGYLLITCWGDEVNLINNPNIN